MFDVDNSPRLQSLINAAGLRSSVRHRLLNGQRRQVAAEFDLTEHEAEVVMTIEAETLRDFARDLHERIVQQQLSTAKPIFDSSHVPFQPNRHNNPSVTSSEPMF